MLRVGVHGGRVKSGAKYASKKTCMPDAIPLLSASAVSLPVTVNDPLTVPEVPLRPGLEISKMSPNDALALAPKEKYWGPGVEPVTEARILSTFGSANENDSP